MLLRQTVAAVAAPVTVDEAKAVSRVDYADDDVLISELITVAARLVGAQAGRILTSETWAVSFPSGSVTTLALPLSPVQSVTGISFFDADDVQQTAQLDDFRIVIDDDRASVTPKDGGPWPVAHPHRADAITVTFVAGYTSCPVTLKHAVLMTVAHLYGNREAVGRNNLDEVPLGASALINVERLGWAAG